MFDFRSVFVVVVIKQLKGKRDYGQQTLATCIFLRSHVRREAVNIVIVCVCVCVKLPGVKSKRFNKHLKSG